MKTITLKFRPTRLKILIMYILPVFIDTFLLKKLMQIKNNVFLCIFFSLFILVQTHLLSYFLLAYFFRILQYLFVILKFRERICNFGILLGIEIVLNQFTVLNPQVSNYSVIVNFDILGYDFQRTFELMESSKVHPFVHKQFVCRVLNINRSVV